MIKRYDDLSEYEIDLFNIIRQKHDLLDATCAYIIKDIIRLNGDKREVYCIEFFSKKHRQIMQTTDYSLSELNKILRKEKLEKINRKDG